MNMKKVDDGGSAFPSVSPSRSLCGNAVPEIGGMSLRDWFAGMSLQGLRSSNSFHEKPPNTIAGLCYLDADAMIAERVLLELNSEEK